MLPGLGKFDPKKMQGLMKQMGISQEEIPAERVIIEKPDSSKIIISNPQVTKIKMQGQESFQVVGDIEEQSITEEDIKLVMEKTSCSKEAAKKALEETQDIAEAILKLSE